MLAGARVRQTDRRYDIVVPHPAGARGVYIIALQSVAEFCTPTLHDMRLLEAVAALHPLTPSAMRSAARAVAAEGTAGRAAAAAAARIEAREQQAEQSFAMRLLLSLTRDGDGGTGGTPEQRAAQAVLKLAGRTGRDAAAVHSDIKRLARLVIASGFGDGPPAMPSAGRCRVLLDMIVTTAMAMLSWAEEAGSASRPACTQFAAASAALRAAGHHVLSQVQAIIDDPSGLLTAWAAGPEAVAANLGRPGWLLDGWESLCLMWQLAETDDQRAAAAAEACLLVPPMPPEMESWLAAPVDLSAFRRRHAASPRLSSPASQAVSAVARNEQLRALAA